MSNVKSEYKRELSFALNADANRVFLFWKGRVALYALLKSLGVKEGDEVILPAFTCVVVPNAILYLGAKPVYVDIDARTYNLNPDLLEKAITSKTKVILAQNTFGLSPDMDRIMEIAKRHSISVLEDCTHGFGGTYKGRINGTIAEASFFSTQWNKPFSTGVGGFALVNNASLVASMSQYENEAQKPGAKKSTVLSALLLIREWIGGSTLYWTALDVYRWLSEKNIVVGSSGSGELDSIDMPADYFMGLSDTQARRGIGALKSVKKTEAHQKAIAQRYDEFLKNLGIPPVFVPDGVEHSFLKYPLLVNDRNTFLDLARRAHIELGEWFVSPIHPIESNFEKWKYYYGTNPIAEKVSAQMVNLPTNIYIGEKELQKIFSFLSLHQQMLVRPDSAASIS